jgi:hypothetical protein
MAQQILPAYKNGHWWLTDGKSNVALPNDVTYIGLFDAEGYAIYIQQNSYGILNEKGKNVIDTKHTSIKSLGFGLFQCFDSSGSSIKEAKSNRLVLTDARYIKALNDSYLLVYKDSSHYLVHKESRVVIRYADTVHIRKSYFNTLLVQLDSVNCDFYTAEGKLYQTSSSLIDYTNDYIHLKSGKTPLLITNSLNLELDSSNSNIVVSGNWLSYFDGKNAHLLNLETTESTAVLPFDKISPAYFGGYLVWKKDRMGWVDKHFKLKIPVDYDYIQKSFNYYSVTKNGLTGFYDSAFVLRIPCELNYFIPRKDFLWTYSTVNTQGLYSLHSNRTILPPIYDRIYVKDQLIKAYTFDKLKLLELGNRHQVVSEVILKNALTAKQRPSYSDDTYTYDKRLLSLGWYLETKPVFDSNSVFQKYAHRWGLKNHDDSILLYPRFNEPKFIPQAGFSLIPKRKIEFRLLTGKKDHCMTYQMWDYTKARPLNSHDIIELDTLDCYTRTYIRFETTKGYKILLADNSIKDVNYVSSSSNEYLPYCIKGKLLFTEENSESVLINHLSLNGKKNQALLYAGLGFFKKTNHVHYEGAQWNYLDTNGQDLYDEQFDFATDFQRGTAIVKRKSGWGLINKDSVLIPLQFSTIERIKQYDDTLFLVTRNQYGKQYLNNKAELLDPLLNQTIRTLDDLSMVQQGKDKVICFNGTEIVNGINYARLLSGNYFAVRDKKELVLYNEQGNEVMRSLHKPICVLTDKLFVVQSSSNNGLIDQVADTILPFEKQEINKVGIFIVSKTAYSTKVFDTNMSLIIESKSGEKIWLDTTSNQIAVVRNNHIIILGDQGKKQIRFKHPQAQSIVQFQYGYFVGKTAIFNSQQEIQIEKKGQLTLLDEGLVAINDERNNVKVYWKTLDSAYLNLQGKKLHYLGSNIFLYRTREGIVLQSGKQTKVLGQVVKARGRFENGFCLFQSSEVHFYLNTDLVNSFNVTFEDATPFKNEMATVKISDGWTIIDRSGILQSYPSFGKIIQLTPHFFETTNKPTFGLYDSHGKELIPPIYEKISFLNNNMIQVIKNGEIGYLTIWGKSIFSLD